MDDTPETQQRAALIDDAELGFNVFFAVEMGLKARCLPRRASCSCVC